MNGMRIDKSRWGLGGCGWGGVPARQNPHRGKTIGAGRKKWRLKGGRTFVSDACHKSGPYLPFRKPWTSLWGAISFGQHFQATTETAAPTVLRSCLDGLEVPHLTFPAIPSCPAQCHDWIVRCHKISEPQPLLRGRSSGIKSDRRERYIWEGTIF